MSGDRIFSGIWCNVFTLEISVVGAKPGLGAEG